MIGNLAYFDLGLFLQNTRRSSVVTVARAPQSLTYSISWSINVKEGA